MLKTFLPLFVMTFFICLFIVLMQFLWKYIDDLVGKGLDIEVLGELFFYAALTLIPLALPLSLLLASLMVFGNLGEHLELTAMKSSGISLLRVMSPLIVIVSIVSVAAFFFQNDVLPKAQVKMWTLLFSARQKSPELDIPEGAFYDGIDGYNLFVKQKNKDTGELYHIMIYDVSDGNGYANILLADSAKLSFTENKKHLFLQLFTGEEFEDLKDNRPMASANNMLYRRESFHDKSILIPFDANFNRLSDQNMRNQYVGKNIAELRHTIDSVSCRIDSAGTHVSEQMKEEPLFGVTTRHYVYKNNVRTLEVTKLPAVKHVVDIDSVFNAASVDKKRAYVAAAMAHAYQMQQQYEFMGFSMQEDYVTVRRHQIEMQKKFTLSLACLIFFFIGAPLGAIIRKGGLGAPLVISVILFIIYYVIDNSGYKMARDGRWEVWQGIWLSSAVLLPLGIFLTYKAINDSAVLNPDAYRKFFKRITGTHVTRHVDMKEVVIDNVVPDEAIRRLNLVKDSCGDFLKRYSRRQSYVDYWMHGYDKALLRSLSSSLEDTVDYLSNSRNQLVINKLMDFPVIRQLLSYHPTNYPKVGMAFVAVFPVGFPFYIIGVRHQRNLRRDLRSVISVCNELIGIYSDFDKYAAYNRNRDD